MAGTVLDGARGLLIRTHRADDCGAAVARHLDRVVAHGTCRARHQDRLPVHGAVGKHQRMRRHRRNAETGPFGKALTVRKRVRARRIQDDIFRGGPVRALPVPLEEPDPLADPCRVDSFAYRLDNAGTIEMRDHPVTDHRPALTGAALDVQRVDPRGVHPNQYLSGTRDGCVLFSDLENVFGGPEVRIPGCAHWLPPSVSDASEYTPPPEFRQCRRCRRPRSNARKRKCAPKRPKRDSARKAILTIHQTHLTIGQAGGKLRD